MPRHPNRICCGFLIEVDWHSDCIRYDDVTEIQQVTYAQAIIKGVYAGDPVSNLERLGLSPRILALLETSCYQIVTLEDLVSRSRDDMLSIRSVGEKSLEQILECLSRYDELQRTTTGRWIESREAFVAGEIVAG
ncbi:MAG: hypothetical protein H6821_16175 [Planctomycetaceae bacterium]|nr:hypothetical protein [Planctomycetales bacterium]MCB9875707.1 hypothetical protein [Planctomycetaceae bacterium]